MSDRPVLPEPTSVPSAAGSDPGSAPSASSATPQGAGSLPPMPGVAIRLEPGHILHQTYEILALLARGGMGEVYKARHTELGTLHAVKVILPELAGDPRFVEMFKHEAKKLKRIRHDAVVAYEGMSRDELGRRYIAMEFVEGIPLSAVIKERALSPDEVRRLRDRCADGLAAAHDKGVFHRDIAPDNIVLVEGKPELAKIIDFGIAKSADPGEGTVVGSDFAGKFSWVAPEQFGAYGGLVDGRTDIYSLGLVLAAAAQGRRLDMGNSPISAMEKRQKVPDLSGVPDELRGELAPLLEPDPAKRPPSMRVLPRAPAPPEEVTPIEPPPPPPPIDIVEPPDPVLPPVPEAEPSAPPKPAPPVPGEATARQRRLLAIVGGVLGLAFIAAGIADIWHGPDPGKRRDEAAAKVQAAIGQLPCADLAATVGEDLAVKLDGFVSRAADAEVVRGAVAKIPGAHIAEDHIATLPPPLCGFGKLAAGRATGSAPAAPRLVLGNANGRYKMGERLTFMVAVGDRDGYLTVDYVDAGGSVYHMLPRPQREDNHVAAGQLVEIGSHAAQLRPAERAYEIMAPLGTNLVLVVMSPKPLFEALRPEEEPAAAYLDALTAKLPANETASAYRIVTTVP